MSTKYLVYVMYESRDSGGEVEIEEEVEGVTEYDAVVRLADIHGTTCEDGMTLYWEGSIMSHLGNEIGGMAEDGQFYRTRAKESV